MRVVDVSFELPNYRLSGKHYIAGNDDRAPRVIAIHGWLDNCGSFFRLAPLLKGCDVLALDLAGNGFSDHRGVDAEYTFWADVADVIMVADQLGWQEFHLVGHSRGAGVSTMLAGTFAERVQSVNLIDGGIPMIAPSTEAPQQLRKSIEQRLAFNNRPSRIYPSKQLAAEVRGGQMWPLSEAASMALVEQGMQSVEGGWQWQSDRRLNLASQARLSFNQVKAYVDAIDVPIKMIAASDGIFSRFPELRQTLETGSAFDIVEFAGTHHLHMEAESVDKVAAEIMQNIAKSVCVSH